MHTKTRDLAPSQTEGDDGTSMDPMDDLPSVCPSCGYPGLELDTEFNALVHDYCGYWMDL